MGMIWRLFKRLWNRPNPAKSPAGSSAFTLGAANEALGDQRVDLAVRVAELLQHFSGVLAEFWRNAAQARLAAVETDRRSHAFVPVLFEDIATMDGVSIGQGLVDRLYRSGRQSGREQPVAQWRGVVLAEHGGEF